MDNILKRVILKPIPNTLFTSVLISITSQILNYEADKIECDELKMYQK